MRRDHQHVGLWRELTQVIPDHRRDVKRHRWRVERQLVAPVHVDQRESAGSMHHREKLVALSVCVPSPRRGPRYVADEEKTLRLERNCTAGLTHAQGASTVRVLIELDN